MLHAHFEQACLMPRTLFSLFRVKRRERGKKQSGKPTESTAELPYREPGTERVRARATCYQLPATS